MTQVAGPYDLLGAIRRSLPKTLKILDGESVTMEWFLRDELPVTPPNAKGTPHPNPHGVFQILPPVRILNNVAAEAQEPYRLALTDKTEAIAFATGTLSYEVVEQDIASVTSVTGTLSAVAGHVFVADTDYTFTVDSIVWTSGGQKPDNATNFTVVYKHRMYYPRKVMDSRVTVRAIIKAKTYTGVSRKYPMSVLAAVLGSALEMKMRSMSGNRMVRPATTDEPYTETVTMGRVLSSGPLPVDESGSLAPWFVDFTLNIGGIWEDDPVQNILDLPFTVDSITQ